MRRTYSQIDMDERRRIARWRAAGLSATVIAEKLGRHRSTGVAPKRPDMLRFEIAS